MCGVVIFWAPDLLTRASWVILTLRFTHTHYISSHHQDELVDEPEMVAKIYRQDFSARKTTTNTNTKSHEVSSESTSGSELDAVETFNYVRSTISTHPVLGGVSLPATNNPPLSPTNTFLEHDSSFDSAGSRESIDSDDNNQHVHDLLCCNEKELLDGFLDSNLDSMLCPPEAFQGAHPFSATTHYNMYDNTDVTADTPALQAQSNVDIMSYNMDQLSTCSTPSQSSLPSSDVLSDVSHILDSLDEILISNEEYSAWSKVADNDKLSDADIWSFHGSDSEVKVRLESAPFRLSLLD